jgi:hypothetical protein
MDVSTATHYKEKMVQLAAFEATYHYSITPMISDMVPLIINTGASISLNPHKSDFTTLIRPVQHITIKGIALGLTVKGVGDLSYTYHNDNGEEQTMILRNCLYVPQCVVQLICITSFENYSATIHAHFTSQDISPNPIITLTKRQCQKPYLHELCTHEGFHNLNRWIRKEKFPGVDPNLSEEPDPTCTFCNFGEARRICHKTHMGHISAKHAKPGQGVSLDGLESGTPGRPFFMKGSPPTQGTIMYLLGLTTCQHSLTSLFMPPKWQQN